MWSLLLNDFQDTMESLIVNVRLLKRIVYDVMPIDRRSHASKTQVKIPKLMAYTSVRDAKVLKIFMWNVVTARIPKD